MRLNPRFNLDRELGAVSRFMNGTLARGRQPLDPASFLNGASRFNLATDQPGLEKVEQRNLSQFLLLNSLVKPLAQSGFDQAVGNMAQSSGLMEMMLNDSTGMDTGGDGLEQRVEELEAQLSQQQNLIQSLESALAAGTPVKAPRKKAAKKSARKKVTSKKARRKKAGRKKTGRKKVSGRKRP